MSNSVAEAAQESPRWHCTRQRRGDEKSGSKQDTNFLTHSRCCCCYYSCCYWLPWAGGWLYSGHVFYFFVQSYSAVIKTVIVELFFNALVSDKLWQLGSKTKFPFNFIICQLYNSFTDGTINRFIFLNIKRETLCFCCITVDYNSSQFCFILSLCLFLSIFILPRITVLQY